MTRDSRSVLTRPAPPPDVTVRYGDHPDHVADVRRPPGRPGPLVIFLHGGFWRHEYDRGHTGPLASALAARRLRRWPPRSTAGPGRRAVAGRARSTTCAAAVARRAGPGDRP